MRNLWLDLRYGFRSMARNRVFSATVVLTLALGIGANSAIFSLVYAALLRPLPFADAGRLVFVTGGKLQEGKFTAGLSARELEEWQPQLRRIFDASGIVSASHDTAWAAGSQGTHLHDRDVSPAFFDMLGVRPFAGRLFTPADSAPGSGGVAVLSYEFWQRQFAGDLNALGQTIRKRGGAFPAYTIIGILPARFQFDNPTDIWTPQAPLSAFEANTRVYRPFRLMGHLAPNVSLTQAQAAMDAVAAQQAATYPASNKGWGIRIVSLSDRLRPASSLALLLLWAAVGCLLLIACANTANLLLARAGARRFEIGVRLALGASRRRLIAQLLTESAQLAILGAALGWLASAWALRTMPTWGAALLPAAVLEDMVRLHANALDPAVAAFTLAACVAAVLAFGLAPARRATRMGLHGDLQTSGRASRSRLPQMLVTAEVAVVVMLALSAGLLIRSLVKLTSIDPGFQAVNRLTFDIELPRPTTTTRDDARARSPRMIQWYEELEQRLQSIPGVQAAGISNAFPLTQDPGGWGVMIANRQLPPETSMAFVSPSYFAAAGAPIVEGSNFSPSAYTMPGAKALIINRTLARLLFPDASAVGRTIDAPRCGIDLSREGRPANCIIVGVAQDTRFALDTAAPPTFYYAIHQDVSDRVTFVIRAGRDPAPLMPAVRAVVAGMPDINGSKPYLFRLRKAEELVAEAVAEPRFRSRLVAVFASLALLLAAIGIYGVQAHAVTRRTREIGVRMALGANPAAVLAMILRESAAWTLAGIALGLAGGLAATRLISGLLFGITRWDPVTLAVSPTVILAAALLATWLPGRQAMRVDPAVALRSE